MFTSAVVVVQLKRTKENIKEQKQKQKYEMLYLQPKQSSLLSTSNFIPFYFLFVFVVIIITIIIVVLVTFKKETKKK